MTTKTSPLVVKVKKEILSEEINEFAETAMNELLGWYGYGNVDRSDTKISTSIQQVQQHDQSSSNTTKSLVSRISSIVRENSSTPEQNSSSDNSKSPILRQIINKQDVDCGWCRRPVSLSSPEFLATPEGPKYCTESCFAQSRRASFKRAKTCDWCHHIRHAVSYVDFQDGASQLQFCSDKCLNQYKMQIFCKETQAHLDMNPHLKGKGIDNEGGLITPDLWLKNCRSRSASPCSDRSKSVSPNPQNLTVSPTVPNISTTSTSLPYKPIITVAPSSKLMSRPPQPQPQLQQLTSINTSPALSAIRKAQKSARKRRSIRLCSFSTNMQNRKLLNTRSNVSLLNISTNNNNTQSDAGLKPATLTSLQDLSNSTNKTINNNTMPLINNGGISTNIKRDHTNHFLPPPPNLYPLRHPIMQNHSRFMQQQQPSLQVQPPLSASPQQSPHSLPTIRQTNGSTPKISPQLPTNPHTTIPPHATLSPHTTLPPPPPMSSLYDQRSPYLFGCPAPPVTVLVPYPIILPIPIPIPIPMPITEFIKAAQAKLDEEKKAATNNGASSSSSSGVFDNINLSHPRSTTLKQSTTTSLTDNEPLDCTKSKTTTPPMVCSNIPESIPLSIIIEKENPTKEITEEQLANDIIQEEICIDSSENTCEPIIQESSPLSEQLTPSTSKEKVTIIDDDEDDQPQQQQQRLPKLKITRFNSKRIVAKEIPIQLESSRPLRKRKRVINCDYLRIRDDDKKKI